MRGEATVTFDFAFKYSDQGEYKQAKSVSVRAPALGKFHVHTTMTKFVMDAVTGLQEKRPTMMKGNEDQAVSNKAAEGGGPDNPQEMPARAIMQMMSIGLDRSDYDAFVKYMHAELVGSPKLAVITDTNIPLSDACLEDIVECGGISALYEIMGAFTRFFFIEALGIDEPGSVKSPTSSKVTKAASPTNTRSRSRGQSLPA